MVFFIQRSRPSALSRNAGVASLSSAAIPDQNREAQHSLRGRTRRAKMPSPAHRYRRPIASHQFAWLVPSILEIILDSQLSTINSSVTPLFVALPSISCLSSLSTVFYAYRWGCGGRVSFCLTSHLSSRTRGITHHGLLADRLLCFQEFTNPSARKRSMIDFQPSSFQRLTNCSFGNSFVFSSIRIAGGWHPSGSLEAARCRTSTLQQRRFAGLQVRFSQRSPARSNLSLAVPKNATYNLPPSP